MSITLSGVSADRIVQVLSQEEIAMNINELLRNGVDAKRVIAKLSRGDKYAFFKGLTALIKNGTDIDWVVSILSPARLVDKSDVLVELGADTNSLVNRIMTNRHVAFQHVDLLSMYGANITNLADVTPKKELQQNFKKFIEAGADIDRIIARLSPDTIIENLDYLFSYHAEIDVNNLIQKTNKPVIIYLDTLMRHGADINLVLSEITSTDISCHLEELRSYGAADDDLILGYADFNYIISHIEKLVKEQHIDIEKALMKADQGPAHCTQRYNDNIVYHLEKLLGLGADPNGKVLRSVAKLKQTNFNLSNITKYLDLLLAYGANIDIVIDHLKPWIIIENYDYLIQHGAKIDLTKLCEKMKLSSIIKNLDFLVRHGAVIDLDELEQKH